MTSSNHALPHPTAVSVALALTLLLPAVGVAGESRLEPVDAPRHTTPYARSIFEKE